MYAKGRGYRQQLGATASGTLQSLTYLLQKHIIPLRQPKTVAVRVESNQYEHLMCYRGIVNKHTFHESLAVLRGPKTFCFPSKNSAACLDLINNLAE